MGLLWKRLLAVSFICLASSAHAKGVNFERSKIILAGKTLTVELAKTAEQHEQGLMLRKKMPDQEGMLFVFPDEQVRYFWMKNTIIDLSIGYFDQNRVLIDIQEMKATSMMETRPPSYPSAKPAMYALEMNKGWFAKNGIKIGQKFEFSKR
jgi:uncharacterized membrane protein (UPF0127 family)